MINLRIPLFGLNFRCFVVGPAPRTLTDVCRLRRHTHVHPEMKSEGEGGGATPRPPPRDAPADADESEEVDLSDSALEKLVPEFTDDPDAMNSLKELRDLQVGHNEVFKEYLLEKQKLEENFERRFAPYFAKRKDELSKGKVADFWTRCLDNCEMLANNITEKDALVMQYLDDISCETITSEMVQGGTAPDGLFAGSFILRFKFRSNPFFTNEVLTKTYVLESFDDFPEAKGCKINWKPGKNLTVRVFRKKAKNGKVLMKTELADSFFNFFSPPDGVADDDDGNSDVDNVIEADVELGEAIRSDLIPRALYYFLDIEDEDDGDDGEDDEDDDGGPNGL